MKVNRIQEGFTPVTITLETLYEVALLTSLLGQTSTVTRANALEAEYPWVVASETDKDPIDTGLWNKLDNIINEEANKQ